jgi:hypothetical protein
MVIFIGVVFSWSVVTRFIISLFTSVQITLFRQGREAEQAAGPPGPGVRRLRAALQPAHRRLPQRGRVPQDAAGDQRHLRLQEAGQEHGVRDGQGAHARHPAAAAEGHGEERREPGRQDEFYRELFQHQHWQWQRRWRERRPGSTHRCTCGGFQRQQRDILPQPRQDIFLESAEPACEY